MFCRHQDLFELPVSDRETFPAAKESKKKKPRRVIISSDSSSDGEDVPGTSSGLKRMKSGFGRLQ